MADNDIQARDRHAGGAAPQPPLADRPIADRHPPVSPPTSGEAVRVLGEPPQTPTAPQVNKPTADGTASNTAPVAAPVPTSTPAEPATAADWGLGQERSGVSREMKLGVVAVSAVLIVFGFMLYRQMAAQRSLSDGLLAAAEAKGLESEAGSSVAPPGQGSQAAQAAINPSSSVFDPQPSAMPTAVPPQAAEPVTPADFSADPFPMAPSDPPRREFAATEPPPAAAPESFEPPTSAWTAPSGNGPEPNIEGSATAVRNTEYSVPTAPEPQAAPFDAQPSADAPPGAFDPQPTAEPIGQTTLGPAETGTENPFGTARASTPEPPGHFEVPADAVSLDGTAVPATSSVDLTAVPASPSETVVPKPAETGGDPFAAEPEPQSRIGESTPPEFGKTELADNTVVPTSDSTNPVPTDDGFEPVPTRAKPSAAPMSSDNPFGSGAGVPYEPMPAAEVPVPMPLPESVPPSQQPPQPSQQLEPVPPPPTTMAAQLPAPAVQPQIHIVRPNENYWSISKSVYGTGRYFSALARFNAQRIPDPKKMRPGMQVLVPPRDVLEKANPDLFPRRVARLSPEKPAGFFLDPHGRPMYRVGPDDNLGSIAHAHLGRFSRWIEIYRLNQQKLPDPNKLQLGTELELPTNASRVRVVQSPGAGR